MIQWVLALSLLATSPIEGLNDLAKARNIDGIEALASPELKGSFAFLRRQGAFGVGRFGWSAIDLPDPFGDREFVVFSTPLTTQDYGEMIYRVENGKIVEHIPETEYRGAVIDHLDMEISFDVPAKVAKFSTWANLRKKGDIDDSYFVRLGPNFKVSSVTDDQGKAVEYQQAGGTILLPNPGKDKWKLKFNYEGVVDTPRFSGAIVDDEVMLTNDLWWPAIARHPVTFTTKTTVPKNWLVVAQGEKTAESTGESKTVSYKMDLPICWLSLSAGAFKHKSRMVGGKEYHVWTKEMTDEEMETQLELLPPVIQFFSKLKPLPFSSYGQVVTKLYGGGALEAYSYATYGTGWLPDEDPHEPSHTWFGGIKANTYMTTFWNESWASFSENWYRREGAIGDVNAKRKVFVDAIRTQPGWSAMPMRNAGAFVGPPASIMGYGKGSYVLQQLEYEMGREQFVAATKKWLETPAPDRGIEWEDFAEVCGPEWQWFFDQWLDNSAWPTFDVKNVRYEDGALKGTVEQADVPYRAKVEILVRTGKESQSYSAQIEKTLGGVSTFSIPMSVKPDAVNIDPFGRLISMPRRIANSWRSESRRFKLYVGPNAKDWIEAKNASTEWPKELDNQLIVADPRTEPRMKVLLNKVGVTWDSESFSYRGKQYPFVSSTFVALVPLQSGGWCGVRMGASIRDPEVGNAQVAVTDKFGRFLDGQESIRPDWIEVK
ncbi:MAG: hypothetical protein KDC26_12095 [Armatimonadetes bacterium]|nr:hypothetical protein [Armatimonadota bacterium]